MEQFIHSTEQDADYLIKQKLQNVKMSKFQLARLIELKQELRFNLINLQVTRKKFLIMKQASLLMRSFFKQLMKYPVRQYFSQPNTIQSSVGLIFKFPDIDNIQTREQFQSKILSNHSFIDNTQLLFVQRAGYHSDKNAYNVVFPGGQCDANQNDINACQRQLKEEIGIQTNKQCIHLGQLPKNFYYLKKKGKQVHISCHAYCLKSSQKNWQPKLNPDELRKFKWVKISELLQKDKYKKRNEIKIGIFQRMPAFAAKIAKQNILQVTMSELDLGMDRNLWGITLYVWSYILQMALNETGSKLKSEEISLLRGCVETMNCFQLQFRPYSLYKIPATLVASGWHYLYRVRPFKYEPGQFKGSLNLNRKIMLLVLFFVVINLFYAIF